MGMDRIKPSALRSARKLVGEKFSEFLKDESGRANVDITKIADSIADTLKSAAKAAVISGSMIGGAAARPLESHAPKHAPHTTERRLEHNFFSPKDVLSLAKNVINEACGEPTLGQIAVMQVTLARSLDKHFHATIHDVVYAKNQFSWTHDEDHAPSAKDPLGVAKLAKVLDASMRGRSPELVLRQLSALTHVPVNALFYKRTDWNEHDPHDKHLSHEARAFFSKLVKVGEIGHHTFYAAPQHVANE